MLDICLAGTAGMVPLKNRWLTTLYSCTNGHATLIDCGEGTQIALNEAGCKLKQIDLICITHFHADHIAGLPGLLLTMGNSGRTESISIVGPPGLSDILKKILVIAVPPFKVFVFETDGKDDSNFRSGQIKVHPFKVDHVVPCLGYTIEVPRKPAFNPRKATEQDIPVKAWSILQNGESVKIGTRIVHPESVMEPPRRGLKVLYSTDTRPVDSIIENGQSADLMILEGQYGDNTKLEKAKEWGHMTFPEAAKLARDAGAKELWLTHFSQSIKDPAEFIDNAREIFPNSHVGFDGKKKMLTFID